MRERAVFDHLCEWVRFCPTCGTSLGKFSYFCESCWEKILKEKSFQRTRHGDFVANSLFDYGKPFGQALILLQKQGIPYPELLSLFRSLPLETSCLPCQIVAAPGIHALRLAMVMACLHDGFFAGQLQKPFSIHQKRKSRGERKQMRLHWSHPPPHDCQVIFVDDLVTTGSTVGAGYQALGRPQNFVVVTLARAMLSSEERLLIKP